MMKTTLSIFIVFFCNLALARGLPPVVDQSGYYAGDGSGRPLNQGRYNEYEILDRLQQLQSELQGLRGEIEQQNYKIEELKRSQQNMYTDVDTRLQVLEGAGTPAVNNSAYQQPSVSETTRQTIKPETIKPPHYNNEKSAYQHAYETLRSGRNAESIELFNRFLLDYPNGDYADNAQYWLGEAYKVGQDIGSAREAFRKLIDNYPASSKVPDAMLKLGYIEHEMGNSPEARDIFHKILVEYPGTTAAHLAERKLAQLNR